MFLLSVRPVLLSLTLRRYLPLGVTFNQLAWYLPGRIDCLLMDTTNNGLVSTYGEPSSNTMDTDVSDSSTPTLPIGARVSALKEMLGQIRQQLFDDTSSSYSSAPLPKRTFKTLHSHKTSLFQCFRRVIYSIIPTCKGLETFFSNLSNLTLLIFSCLLHVP